MTPSPSNDNSVIQNHQDLHSVKKQVMGQPQAAASVTQATAAELVLEQMYERFFEKFPPADARVVEVQKWILRWFALDDTYINDIAVPKYVSHLTISGSRLRTLSDVAILQFLAIQNIRLCSGSGGQLYPKEVIEKLAADIVEARRRVIRDVDGQDEAAEKGKLKRLADEGTPINKRLKLMDSDTCEQKESETKSVGGLTESELRTNLSNAFQAHLTISQLSDLNILLGSNPIAPVIRTSANKKRREMDNSTGEAEIIEFSTADDSELMQDTDGSTQIEVDTSGLDSVTGMEGNDDDAYDESEEMENEPWTVATTI